LSYCEKDKDLTIFLTNANHGRRKQMQVPLKNHFCRHLALSPDLGVKTYDDKESQTVKCSGPETKIPIDDTDSVIIVRSLKNDDDSKVSGVENIK